MKIFSYENNKLKVHLLNNRDCTYFDVPHSVYMQLINSANQIAFFNENIWGNKYEHLMEWESLEQLLDAIADILLVDPPISVNEQPIEDTPIHVVAIWGDIKALDMLISAGANVNIKGDLSCTALYNAVSFNHYRCAKILIDAGATVDDLNELNTSAIKRALNSDNVHLIKLFSSHA